MATPNPVALGIDPIMIEIADELLPRIKSGKIVGQTGTWQEQNHV